ncbi:MAG: glycogen synthase [Chloroflexia bacterium]|nr:glycogen synthase [Chloroflexia bacterium]
MDVLFITNLYPPFSVGGYEQICHDVAQSLRARGHVVNVLTSNYRVAELKGPEPGVYRRLRLKRDWQSPGILTNFPGVLHSIHIQRHNVRTVRQVLSASRPRVVMVWNGMHMGHGFLSAVERRATVVYYLSDAWLAWILAQQAERIRLPVQRRIYHALLALLGIPSGGVRADHLLFCSHALRQMYADLGAEVSKGTVIYHGVSSDIFSPRPQHIVNRAPHQPVSVLYSGQIAHHKGVHTVVEALACVRKEPGLEDVVLGLLGGIASEEYRRQLDRRIVELGLVGAVHFLGKKPRTELADEYAKHDLFVFPSEWVEPFSLSLLEGMAVGIPVISTTTGGSSEIVRDGENALAFQAGSPRDLAVKLSWAIKHPQEMAAMGLRASSQIAAEYTLDAEVTSVESYLRAATGGGNTVGSERA